MNHSVTTPPLPCQHSLTGWIFVGFLSSVLLVVGLLRFQGMTALPDDAPVSWQRALRFEDRPNGDIAVLEADKPLDRKSTRLNSSHVALSRMPSSA